MEKFGDFIGSIVAGTAIVGSVVIAYRIGRNVQFLEDHLEQCYKAEKAKRTENQNN